MLTSYKRKIIHWLVVALSWLVAVPPAHAIETGLNTTANVAGFNTAGGSQDLAGRIGAIVGIILSFVGVIFLILMIYGGFLWMTAGGESDKIKKAQSLITNALIGLVIIAAAYAITSFVLTRVLETTGAR